MRSYCPPLGVRIVCCLGRFVIFGFPSHVGHLFAFRALVFPALPMLALGCGALGRVLVIVAHAVAGRPDVQRDPTWSAALFARRPACHWKKVNHSGTVFFLGWIQRDRLDHSPLFSLTL